jgi:hypothetical protein
MWEEIHGFQSPGEFKKFVRYIESQVSSGEAKEVNPDPDYRKGEIYGGRWFKDLKTGEVWRLVPPDIPFKGLWEPVNGQVKKGR